MTVTITPQKLTGVLTPPPSKSQAHRLLIAAYLAGCPEKVGNVAQSQDIQATTACLELLTGRGGPTDEAPILDCGESGSTLRFLIPLALALQGGGIFTGRGRLMERPQTPYFQLFDEKGIFHTLHNGILSVLGTLPAGVYALPGDVSSQFVTGLLYALPLVAGDSDIMLTSNLESRGYVDMTVDALGHFGIEVIQVSPSHYHIPGGQRYAPAAAVVEADYSQAGFYFAANGIGSQVSLEGLNPNSRQGDRIITDYALRLSGPGAVTLDAAQCPDLVPALALHAALRPGEVTHIVGAARLRIKESDRLDTVTSELCKLGAQITQGPDFLTIHGVDALTGGVVESHNDHRIAMMLAMAATRATGPVTIHDAGAVAKSYPTFWADYAALGGQFTTEEQEGTRA